MNPRCTPEAPSDDALPGAAPDAVTGDAVEPTEPRRRPRKASRMARRLPALLALRRAHPDAGRLVLSIERATRALAGIWAGWASIRLGVRLAVVVLLVVTVLVPLWTYLQEAPERAADRELRRQSQIALAWERVDRARESAAATNRGQISAVELLAREDQLRGADLSGLWLVGIDLSDADLTKATLAGANLSEAKLRGTKLRGATLADADLEVADLADADLGAADLSGADLGAALLANAKLSDADLSGATLSRARLRSADLNRANLSGVSFLDRLERLSMLGGSDQLSDADLIRACRLDLDFVTQAQLDAACAHPWSPPLLPNCLAPPPACEAGR